MNQNIQKERVSLTLLYAAIFFCLQLVTVVLAGVLAAILTRLGVLAYFGVPQETGILVLVFMVLLSVVVGVAITFFARKVFLGPVNKIINGMNRLATGDFKARLEFGRPLRKNKAFRELSDSFNTMARELENTEMLRGDFVNNFSHEFKTPIVSIAGFAKLLRRGDLEEEQKEEYLAIIEEESLRLAAMATNILNLTKIENQTILTDTSRFNLSEQIRSCVLLLESRWSKKNLTLELEFPEYQITANEELLKQVWINLLDNAIKFSPPTGEILLKIWENGNNLQVSVTSFGNDIPREKQSAIWNKFYQADESHASQGNGVGLAIVKRVVELHHGVASVESRDGKTTFTVTLPK